LGRACAEARRRAVFARSFAGAPCASRSTGGVPRMHRTLIAALLSSSALLAVLPAAAQTSPAPQGGSEAPAQASPAQPAAPAAAAPQATAAPGAQPASQAASGAADLCKELLAYAEKKAAEPPKPAPGQAAAPAA